MQQRTSAPEALVRVQRERMSSSSVGLVAVHRRMSTAISRANADPATRSHP